LADRLKLLGRVDHEKVQEYLQSADIFVNPSLTESFGIAIIEAACMGLLCVSTDVGAVWEILPPEVLVLAKPNKDSLLQSIFKAIEMK
jgi:phosphatidylinositol glycan class A protein